jgi:hypothetical protein
VSGVPIAPTRADDDEAASEKPLVQGVNSSADASATPADVPPTRST